MGRLKNIFKLSSKITLYIPSTKEVNREIDNNEYVEETAKLFSLLFGGSTSTPGLGYWMSSSAGLIKEKVNLVFAYASEKDLTPRREVPTREGGDERRALLIFSSSDKIKA